MRDDAYTLEDKELHIDTEEGLRDFLQHTKELYAALLDLAESQTGRSLVTAEQLRHAETAFHHACDVTEMSMRSLSLGIPLNDVLVSEIQGRYNDIATVYDLLTIETPQTEDLESAVLNRMENPNTFIIAIGTLSEKAKTLLGRYEDITTIPTAKDELGIGRFHYNQLVAAEKEIAIIADTIRQQRTLLETSLVLQENVTKAIQELDTKLNTLDKELDRFFEPETISADVVAETQKDKHIRITEFSAILSRVLLDERYAAFVREKFHSQGQLESKLQREVARIEAPSKFDVLLGVRHASAFAFLKELTLEEVLEFDRAPRVVVRGELLAKDIPYEVYVEWMYILHDIQMVLQAPLHISFGELFVRAELELLLQESISLK